MLDLLLATTALIGTQTTAGHSVPISAKLRPERVHAAADDFDITVRFENESDRSWYLVWYGFGDCTVNSKDRVLDYVEDLDRDLTLVSCGEYAFETPQFIELVPRQKFVKRITVWMFPPPSTGEELARGQIQPAIPSISPGSWSLRARFAVVRSLPGQLIGSALCAELERSEMFVDASAKVEVDANPRAAWRARRGRVELLYNEWALDGQYAGRYMEFFERLTGIGSDAIEIKSRGEGGALQFSQALKSWDEWFDKNAKRLEWDPRSESYRCVGCHPD